MQDIKLTNLYKRTKKNREIFHDLMPFKVRNILFIATHYDAYNIIKEEQFGDKMQGAFLKLNLYSAPQLIDVTSEEEALEMIQIHHFDLVIIMAGLNKKHPLSISKKIKLKIPNIPILLLVNNNSEIAYYERLIEDIRPYVKKIFVWNGSSRIFMAMVKYIEDIKNLESDVKNGDVRIILLVEDSIKYYSRYLPIIYTQLMLQIQELISDENTNIDEMEKITHIRVRPKLILRSRFKSALEVINKYKNNLLCVITDIEFNKYNKKDTNAGLQLVEYIKSKKLDIPIVIQSSDIANAFYASKFNVNFINKKSNTLSSDIQNFLKENLGFGSFVYRNFSNTKITEAYTLEEFEQSLLNMPDEVILYHAQRDDFSKWLMARGEIYMALRLRDKKVESFKSVDEIRKYCIKIFKDSRLKQVSGKIIPFRPTLIPYSDKFILKLGKGSLGGKGRGLAFISNFIDSIDFKRLIPDIKITIPKTTIIATDEFDKFIATNDLEKYIYANIDFQTIKDKFHRSKLSDILSKKLYAYLEQVKKPLIVRSSGLFEDSLHHPFAGIYSSYFITNNDEDIDNRHKQLQDAIKMVYASIFTKNSCNYFNTIGYKIEEEKMAVIIQELVGNTYNKRYYPHISGVAQSYNFYPFSYMKPHDGFAALCIGLGSFVAGGENAYRICPKYPRLQQMSIEDQIKHLQKHFYALDMTSAEGDYLQNGLGKNLKRYKIADAEIDGNLTHFTSVYDSQNNRIEADLSLKGPRIINFANILNYDHIPLAKTLDVILQLFHQAMDSPVEIEFAVNINERKSKTHVNFYLLQLRPLILHAENVSFNLKSIDKDRLFLHSSKSIGNGKITNIKDVIYVDVDKFDKTKTEEMVKEIEYFNEKMKKENKEYLLIGPGRWGTKDKFTGIPILWPQISSAKVIIEHDLEDFPVDASLGSHFFHNVTSMNIGYISVRLKGTDSYFNYKKLASNSLMEKLNYICHTRFSNDLTIIIDGKKQKAVIFE